MVKKTTKKAQKTGDMKVRHSSKIIDKAPKKPIFRCLCGVTKNSWRSLQRHRQHSENPLCATSTKLGRPKQFEYVKQAVNARRH